MVEKEVSQNNTSKGAIMKTIKIREKITGKIMYEIARESLTGFDFSGWDLRNLDLSCLFLENCNFAGADLRGADCSVSSFDGSDFSHAIMSEADFSYASFNNAKFFMTKLSDSNFSRADFTNANIRHSRLNSTNLFAANFTGSKIGPGANLHQAAKVEEVIGFDHIHNPNVSVEQILSERLVPA